MVIGTNTLDVGKDIAASCLFRYIVSVCCHGQGPQVAATSGTEGTSEFDNRRRESQRLYKIDFRDLSHGHNRIALRYVLNFITVLCGGRYGSRWLHIVAFDEEPFRDVELLEFRMRSVQLS